MANNVQITSKGIQKILRNYNSQSSIAEYIWNGFDANAKIININYTCNAFNTLNHFEIIDDGDGIDFDKLTQKFNPFYDSEKAIELTKGNDETFNDVKSNVSKIS